MPYIGHSPTNAGTFYVLDDLTMSSSTTYTLQVGSVSVTPRADNLLITLDGVIQHNPDAYTVSGSTLTFASAPGSGVDFYGIIMGQSASFGQGSIGAAELKVTGNGAANQFLAGDADGSFTFKDGSLSTTTTTGDILYRANSSALARLGIGSTGQVLTVASGIPAWSTDTEAYLPSAGGTMSGNIAMGGGDISGGGTITGTFVGGITGNVTGNTSGTALTVTQAAQSAITSVGTLTNLGIGGSVLSGNSISPCLTVEGTKPAVLIKESARTDSFLGLWADGGNSQLHFDDSGIFSIMHADDAIGTNSTTVASFHTTGYVGIGEAFTPSEELQIRGTSPLEILINTHIDGFGFEYNSSGATTSTITSWHDDAAAKMNFVMQGSAGSPVTAMTILGSGNVGIGVSDPDFKLEIKQSDVEQSGIKITDSAGSDLIKMGARGAAGKGYMQMISGSTATNVFDTDGVSYFNGGNVGIGTVVPITTMQVGDFTFQGGDLPSVGSTQTVNINSSGATTAADTGYQLSLTETSALGANKGGGISFQALYDGSANVATVAGIKGLRLNNTADNLAGYLSFLTRGASGSCTERMRIDSAGNVMFGTSSNTQQYSDTSGDGSFSFRDGVGSENTYMALSSDASGGYALVYLNAIDGADNERFISFIRSNTEIGSIALNGTGAVQYNIAGSDIRLKKNFADWTESVLPKFDALNPQLFHFKTQDDSEDKSRGYIAQDAVDNFPEAYPKHNPRIEANQTEEYYQFNPSGMVTYLMKAVKELSAKVTALENA